MCQYGQNFKYHQNFSSKNVRRYWLSPSYKVLSNFEAQDQRSAQLDRIGIGSISDPIPIQSFKKATDPIQSFRRATDPIPIRSNFFKIGPIRSRSDPIFLRAYPIQSLRFDPKPPIRSDCFLSGN
jgi:hypothetical protein